MSRKKDPLLPFANLQWTRTPGAETYFDRADELRLKFRRLVVIAAFACLALPFLAFWVIQRSKSPNPIRVYANGRVFSGPLTTNLAVADEDVYQQMRDTVEVLLTRTEKGGVSSLADFVGPGVTEIVENSFTPSKALKSGYSQVFNITTTRALVTGPTWVVLGFRGLLSSRSLAGYQPTELFLVVGFSPGKKTDKNPLGWRLVRVVPDAGGEMFFGKELSKERAERLGLDKS